MKRTISAFVIAVLAITGTFAQFEIKGLVGTNFSTLSNPPDGIDVVADAGFQFGGGILIGEKAYVEPGIQIVRNARTFTADNGDSFSFAQNFVKIPVYAGYHLLGHESGPLALRIFAGPAVAVAGKISKGEDQITKDDINNAMWLADVGVGIDILFLFVEANYEYSFNKFWTNAELESNQRGFLINAGIHIDF